MNSMTPMDAFILSGANRAIMGERLIMEVGFNLLTSEKVNSRI